MTDTSDASHRNLRIGDADRARLADLLDDAYADGRLNRDEHQERMAAARDARTVADISPLVRDLAPLESVVPDLVRPSAATPTAPWRGNLPVHLPKFPAPPVVVGNQEDRIVTILGDTTRGAGYTLAAHTEIVSGLGDVRLDLTSISLAAHDVEIDIRSGLGDVVLLVPEGIRVIDQVGRILGDSKFQGLVTPPADAPTVTLTGFMALGDLRVIGPQHRSFAKKLRRWFGRS